MELEENENKGRKNLTVLWQTLGFLIFVAIIYILPKAEVPGDHYSNNVIEETK